MGKIIAAMLGSSVLAAVVTQLGALILNKVNRKETLEDRNSEIVKKLDEIEQKLDDHIHSDEKRKTDSERIKILRFCDEVRLGTNHSKEHWDEIMDSIDKYERYASGHPDYPNGKAVSAIDHLKSCYRKRLQKNDFLV